MTAPLFSFSFYLLVRFLKGDVNTSNKVIVIVVDIMNFLSKLIYDPKDLWPVKLSVKWSIKLVYGSPSQKIDGSTHLLKLCTFAPCVYS